VSQGKGPPNAQQQALIAVIDSLAAMWNTHDLAAALSFFTDDAVLTIEPSLPAKPSTYRGRDQIRGLVQCSLGGFVVRTRSQHVVEGRVCWAATISADILRQQSIEAIECRCVALVQDGKITKLTTTLTPESVAKLEAAARDIPGNQGNTN
jgi:hypothetical protein